MKLETFEKASALRKQINENIKLTVQFSQL
jgi:hypothetical protein